MENIRKENPEKIENNDKKVDKKKPVQVTPPDGGWGWMVVFASLIVSMLSDGVIYSYGVFTPEFIKHFNLSRSTVGWMGSIMVAITLAVAPLANLLCKKLSYRACGVIGSILSAISFSLPFFFGELWFVILCSSVICGVGFGLVYLPSIIIVNVWFEKKRPLAMGIAVCGSGLGTFVMSPLIEFLVSTYGWRVAMLVIGLILLIMVPCCLTYTDVKPKTPKEVDLEVNDKKSAENKVIETREGCVIIEIPANEEDKMEKEQKLEDGENEEDNDKVEQSEKEEKKSFVEMLKNYVFLLFLLSNILFSIGCNAPYMYAKDRAVIHGISDSKGSFLISSIGIGNCLGRIVFGFLATLKFVNRFHLFNSAVILSGAILIVSWVMTNYISMLAYTFIFGLTSGAFATLISVILIDMFGLVNVDTAFSISLVVQSISVLVGPPFAGFIYDLTLTFNAPFAVCGGTIILSGLIVYLSYFSKDFRKKTFK